MVTLTIE